MIATFDFVETGGFVPQWFSLNEDEGAYSKEYERLHYESKNFLMNMGSIFVVDVMLTAMIILSLALHLFRNKCQGMLMKASTKLNSILYWNLLLRISIELCLELSIIGLLDLKVHNWFDEAETNASTARLLESFD